MPVAVAEEVDMASRGIQYPPLDEIPTFLEDGKSINPELIRAARAVHGDSRMSMATKLEIGSQATIYRWEVKDVQPDQFRLKQLLTYIEQARELDRQRRG